MQGVTITVTGGSNSDNSEMCSVLQGMMQNAGFTNVSVDPASQCQVMGDQDIVSAMRALNPDLFDIPVMIEGTCEYDAIVPGSLMSAMMPGIMPTGFIPTPSVWQGMPWANGFVAPQSLY